MLADLCEMHAVSDASVAERVQALAPWINEQVQRFEDGLVNEACSSAWLQARARWACRVLIAML